MRASVALKVLLGVSLAALTGCRQPETSSTRHGRVSAVDTLAAVTGAILPVHEGVRLAAGCTRAVPRSVTGYYSPSPAQVAQLEQRLLAFLERQRNDTKTAPPPGNYYRQYIGITRAEGRRAIYVNAFPRTHIERLNDLLGRIPNDHASHDDTVRWREHPVSVCDGGAAYWSVEYDVASARFRNFVVNEAE